MANTIQLMKQQVLDMAIRGELVVQRPEEGTSKELLKKINETKNELFNKIARRKGEALSQTFEKDKEFHIPDSWEWTRVGDIAQVNPRNHIEDETTVGFIPMSFIEDGGKNAYVYEERLWKDVKKGYTHFQQDDIVIAKITPCFENMKSAILHELPNKHGAGTTELHVIRTYDKSILNKYLYYIFINKQFIEKGINSFTGTAGHKRIGKDFVENYAIPLPPYLEQKRIVSKIEEIFSIIDKIAERKEDALQTIQLIRQTTLQQAIQGILVEQNEQDEPAKELIARIEEQKDKLIKDKKIKKEKKLPDVAKAEKSFDIPDTWEWVRLGNVSSKVHYGYTSSALEEGNAKMVRITDIQNGRVNWDNVPFCDIDNDKIPDYNLTENDIVIARTGGTVGKSYIIQDIPTQSVFASYLIRVILTDKEMAEYVSKYLESPLYWEQISRKSQGTGQPNVNATQLKDLSIPLPPLSEQKRIVQKIEQIMKICDRMEELFK